MSELKGNCSVGYFCKIKVSILTLIDSIGGKCFFGYYCFEGFMDFIVCELGIYYGGIEVINLSACVFCIVGKFCNILGLFVFDGICFVGYYCFVG